MYVEQRGNNGAPSIVFIHGGGVAGWMWKKQWESFSDFQCLLPDLPDHGKSTSDGPIDIGDCAKRIADLIREKANGGKAHVVGHSLGAKILVELLATQPGVVDHAVVASALFRRIPLMNLMLNMPSYKLIVWMLKSKWVLAKQTKQFAFPDEFYADNFKKEICQQTPQMLDRIYTQLNRHLVLPENLRKAQVPTLVIAGEREPKAMRESAADIAGAMPNAKAFLLKGAKHNYPWGQADEFNEAVRTFIADGNPNGNRLLHVRL